jgi:hypothetical protein
MTPCARICGNTGQVVLIQMHFNGERQEVFDPLLTDADC